MDGYSLSSFSKKREKKTTASKRNNNLTSLAVNRWFKKKIPSWVHIEVCVKIDETYSLTVKKRFEKAGLRCHAHKQGVGVGETRGYRIYRIKVYTTYILSMYPTFL